MKKRLLLLAGLLAASALPAAAGTLENVRARGELVCGVSPGVAGFSVPDEKGAWGGFDVDICRAVAAAVLGDARKVRFTPLSPKDRFVALQTSGDAQVRVHSPFQTVERFIEHVIRDFAAHAPADVELAIKHHPLDRGFSDHSGLIRRLALELGVAGRCHYLHDQHLPTLLRRTIGVVTINSTVGLSAVGEGVPVKVCGEAIYDIEGLVYRGPLARFWTEAPTHRPDFALWQAFRNVLVATTQFNGSFYKHHPNATFASGVFWDKHLPPTPQAERIPFGQSLRPVLAARYGAMRRLPARMGRQLASRLANPGPDPRDPVTLSGRLLPARFVVSGEGPSGITEPLSAEALTEESLPEELLSEEQALEGQPTAAQDEAGDGHDGSSGHH